MPATIACAPNIGVTHGGAITAWEIDDLTGIGPYSVYSRTSGIEANQVVNLMGGPSTCRNCHALARVVFQNKNVMCQYRAVGHPIERRRPLRKAQSRRPRLLFERRSDGPPPLAGFAARLG